MNNRIFFAFFFCSLLCSCKKHLNEIPDSNLQVTRTIDDLLSMEDNDQVTTNSTPGMSQLGSDDYYLSGTAWQTADIIARNAYIWAANPYEGQSVPGWNNSYKAIYIVNAVLERLPQVPVDDSVKYRMVKGGALFFRAFFFYALEEAFGEPFRPASAAKDLGVILRLNSDPKSNPGRATVSEVYRQILSDARQAVSLLPSLPDPVKRNRPSAAAAYALLARVCLTMQDYEGAKKYVDSSLALYDRLMDYNAFDINSTRPFSLSLNVEVLLNCSQQAYAAQYASGSIIDSSLYRSYDVNDLRKYLFFRINQTTGSPSFKGQYTGLSYLSGGPALDELYLIRAECNARAGDKDKALEDLNALLIKRWKTGSFVPYSALTPEEALRLILEERRKETLFRDLRWADLRRLNQDPRFARVLTRIVNGQLYTLPPNDPRYAWPIPDDEIRMSGVPQNPR